MKWWISEFYQEYQFQLWVCRCTSCEQLEEIIYNENPSKQNVDLIVASDPEYAYIYAKRIIRGPWPLGEKVIASDPGYAYIYARNIIRGSWPLGEKAIASDPEYAYYYAKYVIKGPWSMGEKAIASHSYWKSEYEKYFGVKL